MSNTLTNLQHLLYSKPLREGCSQTGISGVSTWYFKNRKMQMPQTQAPSLYLIIAGSLRLYTPSGIMDYTAGQYSLPKIDTPLSGTVLAFSARQDFAALHIKFTVQDVITTVLKLDDNLTAKISAGTLTESSMELADAEVVSAAYRLLNAALPSEFLRRNIMQEIIYYILCGSCGRQFLQSTANMVQTEEIYAANSWIKQNFRTQFTVEKLAEENNMSVSLFHQKFKNAVGMGPLQCQKRLRLTEARRLMLEENKNVTVSAAEVGYESLSQFIRDYRKMFGNAPKEDILMLKQSLQK